MNIFYVDSDPYSAARALHDKHVVKMTLETAQILSTVCHLHGHSRPSLYRPTHIKHPIVLWTASSPDNIMWTAAHGDELAREYTIRFGKRHKSWDVINLALGLLDSGWSTDHTPPPQCMPVEYKVPNDPIAAYRNYYNAEKVRQSRWTKRQPPEWINAQ